MEDMNRRIKEGERRFSIPLYCDFPQPERVDGMLLPNETKNQVDESGHCLFTQTLKLCSSRSFGCYVEATKVTMCFKGRLECLCMNHLKFLEG